MLCFGTTMSSHDILPSVSPIGVYIRLNRKSASELIPKGAENDEVTDTYYIY
jgi:hypothetical protein